MKTPRSSSKRSVAVKGRRRVSSSSMSSSSSSRSSRFSSTPTLLRSSSSSSHKNNALWNELRKELGVSNISNQYRRQLRPDLRESLKSELDQVRLDQIPRCPLERQAAARRSSQSHGAARRTRTETTAAVHEADCGEHGGLDGDSPVVTVGNGTSLERSLSTANIDPPSRMKLDLSRSNHQFLTEFLNDSS